MIYARDNGFSPRENGFTHEDHRIDFIDAPFPDHDVEKLLTLRHPHCDNQPFIVGVFSLVVWKSHNDAIMSLEEWWEIQRKNASQEMLDLA